jgi:transcriptional regulator with XRE-family HTH domain
MSETLQDIASPRAGRDGVLIRQNGPVIRALRVKDGWPQAGFAEALGVTQPALSYIEREINSVQDFRLNDIARLLGVPVVVVSRAVVPCAVCAAREAEAADAA